MARLRNTSTGVVVSVDDDKVDRLGHGWEQVEAKAKRATRKAAADTDDE